MMNENQESNEVFADSLAGFQPIAPTIATGEIMFQAGIEHANRQHASLRQSSRNKMLCWQFATAASLLLAASLSISMFNVTPSPSPSTLAKLNADTKEQTTKIELKKQPKSNVATTTTYLQNAGSDNPKLVAQWRQQQSLSFFGIYPNTDSLAARRHKILRDGIEGLPEIQARQVTLPESGISQKPVTSRTLIQELLGSSP